MIGRNKLVVNEAMMAHMIERYINNEMLTGFSNPTKQAVTDVQKDQDTGWFTIEIEERKAPKK